MATPQPTSIEVFADVACPFTHVGLRRFVERRAAEGRADPILHVRAWPLELVNGRPLDAHHVADEIGPIQADVAPELFAGFDVDRFPTTSLPAFARVALAYRTSLELGERLSLAVRDALFEQGRDIGDEAVLDELAADLGVEGTPERAAAGVDLEEGRERGVVGSPHFFTPDGGFFCPSLDVHRDAGDHLVVHRDPEGFERFLTACFG